jgi:hypothetical protein
LPPGAVPIGNRTGEAHSAVPGVFYANLGIVAERLEDHLADAVFHPLSAISPHHRTRADVQEEALQFAVGMATVIVRALLEVVESFKALRGIRRFRAPGFLAFRVALCLGKTLDFSKSVLQR